jgi:hypothetical protein
MAAGRARGRSVIRVVRAVLTTTAGAVPDQVPSWRLLPVLALALLVSSAPLAAAPQVQVSPGPLSRAHARLEGIANCAKCHDAGHGLSAERCLACHKPIAERMAKRRGVHRTVTDDCRRCHAEHRGADTDLRRLDRQTFDHAVETGYALDGQHARLAANCASCHKARSFLAARTACESCHADAHKGALGRDCARCHRTTVAFKQTRTTFDHATTRFALTGAHREVACEKCHVARVYRGLAFDDCSPCHKLAHRRTMGRTCASCHVTERWAAAAQGFDHAKTAFVLAGAHAQVACAKCHTAGVRNALAHDRCAACHANPHRESIRDDCGKCHDESGFRKAKFDHATRTGFGLTGRHEGLACRKCHTTLSAPGVPLAQQSVDFKGANRDCGSCHKDQHKGEFGRYCESCHQPTTFKAAGFAHPRSPEFFTGAHTGLACVKCHVRRAEAPGAEAGAPAAPGGAAPPSLACSGCHADVHLGQVGPACERCHSVDAPKFQAARFSHDTARFQLAGRHATTPCVKCHASQTAAFPAGTGTAKRLRPVSSECRACHEDPHMGQVDGSCARCHTPSTFKVTAFEHAGLEYLFGVATHARLPCRSCHKTETGRFPAGWGTALRLKVGKTCLECHP